MKCFRTSQGGDPVAIVSTRLPTELLYCLSRADAGGLDLAKRFGEGGDPPSPEAERSFLSLGRDRLALGHDGRLHHFFASDLRRAVDGVAEQP